MVRHTDEAAHKHAEARQLTGLFGRLYVRLGSEGSQGVTGIHWEFSYDNTVWWILGNSSGNGTDSSRHIVLHKDYDGFTLHLANGSDHPFQLYDWGSSTNFDSAITNVSATLDGGGGYHSGDIRIATPWDESGFVYNSYTSFRDPKSSNTSDINKYGKQNVLWWTDSGTGSATRASYPKAHPPGWHASVQERSNNVAQFGNWGFKNDMRLNRSFSLAWNPSGILVRHMTHHEIGGESYLTLAPSQLQPILLGKGYYFINISANVGTDVFRRGSDGTPLNNLEAGTVTKVASSNYTSDRTPYFRLNITETNKGYFPIRIGDFFETSAYANIPSTALNVFAYSSTYDDTDNRYMATHSATVNVTNNVVAVFFKDASDAYLYEAATGNSNHPQGTAYITIKRRAVSNLAYDSGYEKYLYDAKKAGNSRQDFLSDQAGNLYVRCQDSGGNARLRRYNFSAMTGTSDDAPFEYLSGRTSSNVTQAMFNTSFVSLDITNGIIFVALRAKSGNPRKFFIFGIKASRLTSTPLTMGNTNGTMDGYDSDIPWFHLVTITVGQTYGRVHIFPDEVGKKLYILEQRWGQIGIQYARNGYVDYSTYESNYGATIDSTVYNYKGGNTLGTLPDSNLMFIKEYGKLSAGFSWNSKFYLVTVGGAQSSAAPARARMGPRIIEVDGTNRKMSAVFQWDMIGDDLDVVAIQPGGLRLAHLRDVDAHGGYVESGKIRLYSLSSGTFAAASTLTVSNTSPFGCLLTWDAITNATKYKVDYYKTSSGVGTVANLTTTNTTRSLKVTELDANTNYTIRIFGYVSNAWAEGETTTLTTATLASANFNTMLTQQNTSQNRLKNGQLVAYQFADFSKLRKAQVNAMKPYINNMNFTAKQRVRMRLTVRGKTVRREARVVKRGATFNLDSDLDARNENYVYIPFEQAAGSGQQVTLTLQGSDATMTYNESTNQVTFQGETYSIGDTFFVTTNSGQRRILLQEGSVVLVVESAVPQTVPISNTIIVAQNVMAATWIQSRCLRKISLIGGNDTTPNLMRTSIAWYGYDSTTGSTDVSVHTKEGFRMTHTMASNQESASMTFLALRKNSSGTLVLETCMEMEAAQTKIRATNDSGSIVTQFDVAGIQNNSNAWAMYLGGLKQFRIRFIATPGDERLEFEATPDDVSTNYVVKASYNRN